MGTVNTSVLSMNFARSHLYPEKNHKYMHIIKEKAGLLVKAEITGGLA